VDAHHRKLRATGTLKNDVIGRVRLVAYWNYVRIMAHADVILDTYPYGGCLTAQEAMSNGKVVVTLPSEYIRGQFTKNIYQQMGTGGEGGWPIADDKRDFVDIAIRVATNEGEYRDGVKAKMREAGESDSVHKIDEVGKEWAEFAMRAVGE
jgi:predicted O-linked N-acetylglucosamine transferase (SPINDLY family)